MMTNKIEINQNQVPMCEIVHNLGLNIDCLLLPKIIVSALQIFQHRQKRMP